MRTQVIGFAFVLLAVCAGFGIWWLGPWRIPMTLADGTTADGTRFRIVQEYKDFAASGWVIGLYLADPDKSWKLRWTRQADSPWKRASVKRSSEGWIVTAETESDSFEITQDQFFVDVPDEHGWSFANGASRADMQTGLIHTTY